MNLKLDVPFLSASSLLAIAEYFADWHGTVLLYSGGTLDSARSSFLALFPVETLTVFGQTLIHQAGEKKNKSAIQNPWDGLQEHFFSSLSKDPESMAFGWLGYGMGACADEGKILPYRPSSTPDAYWQRCAVVIHADHQKQGVTVSIDHAAAELAGHKAESWIKDFATLEGWSSFLKSLPEATKSYASPPATSPFPEGLQRREVYIDKVEQIKELIREGEIYQVNLSQEFNFQSSREPFSLFRQICETNPAPFSAYIRYEQTSIVSTSPERFLSKKGNELETRPIKGTIQRGKTQEEDLKLKERLLTSPKERAELLMITDLMRNDLGKISTTGSVKTLEIWRCEAYTNVFHLISIIRSIAKANLKPLEIVRSCFPGGSITGCPKLRAMEAIDDFEKRARGIYTGSIGYFTGKGDFDLNIAIRTLVVEGDSYSLQLGGGIVIDSNPEAEYQETLFKGTSFFHLLTQR